MKFHHTIRMLCFSSPVAALLTTTAVHGQTDGTWDGGGGGPIWGGFANWNPDGVIATGAGGTATFASAFGNGRSILLNTSRTLGHVVYTDPGAETAMAVSWHANNPTRVLTLNGLADAPTFNVTQPDRTLTVTARLGGTNGFTKIGPGAMILDIPGSAPNHPVSGPVVIDEGILSLAEGEVLANANLDTAASIAGDATNGLRTTATALTFGSLSGDKNLASVFTTDSGGYDGVTSLTLNTALDIDAVFTGAIAGGASGMPLIKTGPGTQALLGANSYGGTTSVNEGTLVLSTAGSASTGITVANGSSLGVGVVADDSQLAITGDLALGDANTLRVDFGSATPSTSVAPLEVVNFTLGITPTVEIDIDTLPNLLAGQSYPLVTWTGTGPADASAFTLELPNFRILGDLQVTGNTLFVNITSNTAGPISWNTGDATWDTTTLNWLDVAMDPTAYIDPLDAVILGDASGATGNPVITLDDGYAPASVTMDTTGRNYTVSGFGGIDGSGPISLAPTNQGTLTFETENLYNGPITVSGGTLALNGAFSSLGTGANLTMDGGQLELNGTSSTVGTVSITTATASGDTIANGGLSASSFTATHPSGEVTLPADLSGTGGLEMSGAGTLTLSGANTYAGTTTITDGTLKLGAAEVIPGNATVNSLLDLNAFSETVNGLSGSGTVDTLAGGTPTLTVGANNANSTFNGILQNSSGTLSLTKIGTGALTLGGENTLSGSVAVEAGVLAVTNLNPLGNVTEISLANGTTLRSGVVDAVINAPVSLVGSGITATINAPTVVGAGGVTPVPFTLNGPISGDGSVTFNGTQSTNAYGTVVLNAASTYTGDTLVTCSNSTNTQIAVFLGIDNALPTSTVLTLDGGNGTGSGRRATLDLKGFNQTLAGLTNVNRSLRTQHVYNTGASPATLTVNNSTDFTYSGQFGGNAGNGNFGITKSGPGTLTLTSARNHTGDTAVNEGLLALGTVNSLDEEATVTLAGTGATLQLNFAGTDTVGQLVIGGTDQGGGVFGHTDSGADNGGLGVGALDAYFAPGTGTLTVVPPAGGYADWAATNAPTTGGEPAADEDADGVSNALEYVLGGTIATNDLDKLPLLATSGGNITFTFERDPSSLDGTTTVEIEVGTDLETWPTIYTVGADTASSSAGVEVTPDSPEAGIDTVTLTVVQAPDTRKFARLKVLVTP